MAAALAMLGAGYVGLRLLASAGRRLVEVGRRRQAAQQELQADLRAVMERVQVGWHHAGMRALLPGLGVRPAGIARERVCTEQRPTLGHGAQGSD